MRELTPKKLLQRAQEGVEWIAEWILPPLLRVHLVVSVLVVGFLASRAAQDVTLTVPDLIMLFTVFVGAWLGYRLFLRRTVRRRLGLEVGLGTVSYEHLPLANAAVAPPVGKGTFPPEVRARHEAAHAVAALALGHTVNRVNIIARSGVGGTTTWDHREGLNLASVDAVAVLYAGPLAEATGDVVGAPGGMDDYSLMMRTAIAASITDPEQRSPTQILHDGSVVARRIVTEHQDAIAGLSDALIATGGERNLDADEITAIVKPYGLRNDTREQD